MQKSSNFLKSFGLLAIILSLALVPATGLAKEKDRDRGRDDNWKEQRESLKQERENEREERKQEREERKEKREENRENLGYCLKAFGHLIAPGWIKNFGTSTAPTTNCWFPFGINKKFNTSTSTPDVIPPVISQVISLTSTSSINLFWKTNEPATSKVWFSTTTPVASSSASLVQDSALVRNHYLKITGLATSTPYYLIIESLDGSGNSQKTSQFTATTTAN